MQLTMLTKTSLFTINSVTRKSKSRARYHGHTSTTTWVVCSKYSERPNATYMYKQAFASNWICTYSPFMKHSTSGALCLFGNHGVKQVISTTSKNPCYAQATWDWICLKNTKQNKKAKQKQTNKQTNKLRIKGPTWTFPTTSKQFQIKITDKQTA